jgi:hypothetical protein
MFPRIADAKTFFGIAYRIKGQGIISPQMFSKWAKVTNGWWVINGIISFQFIPQT